MTLPNFLVIGAAKSGTTSLHQYLRQHPDVFMSAVKESNWFAYEGQRDSRYPVRTAEEYERLFDGVAAQAAVGEASPQYMKNAVAAERIAAVLPGVRLVGIAARSRRSCLLRLSALGAGSDGAARSRRGVAAGQPLRRSGSISPATLAVRRLPIVNWMLWTGIRGFRRVFPSVQGTGIVASVKHGLLRPPEPLPAPIRSRLIDYFRDDVARTGELIGRDLSHWLES